MRMSTVVTSGELVQQFEAVWTPKQRDQHERADHVRQEPLVLFALDLERLPQLAAPLLGCGLAGGLVVFVGLLELEALVRDEQRADFAGLESDRLLGSELGLPDGQDAPAEPSTKWGLVGLALSGGGIRGPSSWYFTARTNRLWSGFPGTIGDPLSPPFNQPSRVSSAKPPLCFFFAAEDLPIAAEGFRMKSPSIP